MSKRAERRQNLRRMKKRARAAYPWVPGDRSERWANHLAVCSRACCGNPRRWLKAKEKTTRAEQKSDLDFREQLKEG